MNQAETWMLQGGLVLASADHEPVNADIVVKGDRILEIGADIDPSHHAISRIEHADGKLVVPGFVNTHYHSHDRWDRGRFSSMPLEIWMSLYNPPTYGRGWTTEETYLRTLIGGIELLRGGTTCILDDVHLGGQIDDKTIDAVFRAYDDLGIRAGVGIAYSDIPSHETIPYLADILPDQYKSPGQLAVRDRSDMLGCWQDLAGTWDNRVRSVISVSGPQRCTERFQQQAMALAKTHDRPLLTHVLETRIQAMSAYHFYGKSMIDHMNDIGMLSDNTTVIHGVWLNPDDLDLVARSGAGVSHNPVSNAKLGSGIAPVRAMLERNIPVSIGTDNHNANDGCSILEALKFGGLISTFTSPDPDHWLDARDGVRMATEHGAQVMRLTGQIGRLETGYKADFTLFDLSSDAFFPLNDPFVHLAYGGAATALCDVYIDGRSIMRDRKLERVDETAIRQEIQERVQHIQNKVLGGIPDSEAMAPYLKQAYDACLNDPVMNHYRRRFNCCPLHG